jgi:hypothetical protein
MTYTVSRNNSILVLSLCELQAGDLILATDQRFYPIANFPELRPYFPELPPPSLASLTAPDILRSLSTVFIIGIGIYFLSVVADALLAPQRNDEPLTQRDRKYIRERDGSSCYYCLTYSPYGHVDHRVSRANGGSNNYDNLVWACAPCNCSKGALNDTEFLALFQ